jgi:allantoin racemase
MRICVINPNTTRSMTEKIGAAAKAAASPEVEISAVNPDFGPPSIEGYFDEVFSVPGLIEEIDKAAGADAFVIACFDDTGLDAARCATTAPVVGIGEAAFHMATLIAAKFSVVTTLSRSIAPIEHNLMKYGLATRCARVRACDVPVLALENPVSDARRRIEAEIKRALAEDGAEAIVLGRSCEEGSRSGARWGGLRGESRRKPGPYPTQNIEAQQLCAAAGQAVRGRFQALRAALRNGLGNSPECFSPSGTS